MLASTGSPHSRSSQPRNLWTGVQRSSHKKISRRHTFLRRRVLLKTGAIRCAQLKLKARV